MEELRVVGYPEGDGLEGGFAGVKESVDLSSGRTGSMSGWIAFEW